MNEATEERLDIVKVQNALYRYIKNTPKPTNSTIEGFGILLASLQKSQTEDRMTDALDGLRENAGKMIDVARDAKAESEQDIPENIRQQAAKRNIPEEVLKAATDAKCVSIMDSMWIFQDNLDFLMIYDTESKRFLSTGQRVGKHGHIVNDDTRKGDYKARIQDLIERNGLQIDPGWFVVRHKGVLGILSPSGSLHAVGNEVPFGD